MNRGEMLSRLGSERTAWDIVVVGGGATGLGCAVDAASRGLRTALVEAGDFAHGTSSRSTKLIHGGVRYLRSGQFGLVAHSLRERERLRRNAGGLVQEIPFVVPAYRAGERAFYGAGLFLYDLLSGNLRAGGTRVLPRDEVTALFPELRARGLRGGVLYHDDQFDDARLALALARTAVGLGAAVANYASVGRLLSTGGRVGGVVITDGESDREIEIPARAVINATGVAIDTIRRLDDPGARRMVQASRGSHLVLRAASFPAEAAALLPRTDDGRVLFMIPWRGRVLVGTTDTRAPADARDPSPTREDVAYLMEHAARYMERPPEPGDVRSVFAGLRPLLAGEGPTASLRRDHRVEVSRRGLVSVAGGKWTTYRRMAEDAVDRACASAGIAAAKTRTQSLCLDGGDGAAPDPVETFVLGPGDGPSDAERAGIEAFARRAARDDMARNVEDVLARRSRALFLEASGCTRLAGMVARALAAELGRDAAWVRDEEDSFERVAARYLPPGDQ